MQKFGMFNEEDLYVGYSVDKPMPSTRVIVLNDDVDLSKISTYFEYKKEELRVKVMKVYQAKIDAIMALYAPYEIASFADQREEWKRYVVDANAPTPIVDAMAIARGIERDALFAKIGANITGIATIQGQQNAIEDAIKSATTIEELEAIVL